MPPPRLMDQVRDRLRVKHYSRCNAAMAVEIMRDTNFDAEYALLQHEATGIGIVTQVKLQHVNYGGTVVQIDRHIRRCSPHDRFA